MNWRISFPIFETKQPHLQTKDNHILSIGLQNDTLYTNQQKSDILYLCPVHNKTLAFLAINVIINKYFMHILLWFAKSLICHEPFLVLYLSLVRFFWFPNIQFLDRSFPLKLFIHLPVLIFLVLLVSEKGSCLCTPDWYQLHNPSASASWCCNEYTAPSGLTFLEEGKKKHWNNKYRIFYSIDLSFNIEMNPESSRLLSYL